ncbi:methionine ABC transporter ATP-binding protein MetN [Pedobacter gandavensis]|uniref:methionine ABC transporter ATP-binding protein MetN n=1 Tax=Pedobacter gandavensis TaxID=2679963 RepID=UPI00247986E8|nr:methionine ABC transporter ATP-binding protein MetN [Pedobacter gandavensis]WGQ09607.1 methionine ABC transporter ATP-binding protein MetN [Pedobacter gandavensis]
MIELRNITKTFFQKTRVITALSELSLIVPEGKIFGVIGSSGAGKSTLIRCVNLLEKPSSGAVIVDGQNLMALSPKELAKARRHIGMIFQHFNLLSSRTVFENVAFSLELDHTPKAEIEKRVTELLALVGLDEKHHDYPVNLSGGQKQRVAIARTLASNPKVLLCDEATSALDPATTKSILALLKDINKRLNITILLITHEMEVVKDICDEVAVISEGRLIEQGAVSEIFSHPKTELAKAFIASALSLDIPADYKERLVASPAANKRPLLKLEFTGQSVDDPVLSEVARLFQIDSNVISARMDYAGGIKFGVMLIEVFGTQENSLQAIEFYKSKNIKVEVIGYV